MDEGTHDHDEDAEENDGPPQRSAAGEAEPLEMMDVVKAESVSINRSPKRKALGCFTNACVALAVAVPFGVMAGIVVINTSGCPSYMGAWPAWTRSLLMIVILSGCVVTGLCTSAIITGCPRWCSCCTCTRRTVLLFAALLLFVVVILLIVPSTREPYVFALGHRSMYGLGHDWVPPSGYCEDANQQTEWLAPFAALAPGSAAYEVHLQALVSNLTQDEKIRLIQGVGWDWPYPPTVFYSGNVPGVPRLGLPSLHMGDAGQGWRTTSAAQPSRVTSFPCALAAAATWSPSLVHEYARAIGEEFRTKGANAVLGPTVDLVRSPYGGRSPETLAGEEPHLGGPMVDAYVRGLRSVGVAAVMKHFSANSQETGRWGGRPTSISMDAGPRTLMEAHYVPVRAGVVAGASSVMCAYNLVNGTPACGAEWLLRRDLLGSLGFDGYVVSDWTAIVDVPLAAKAPVHMNMPGLDNSFGCPGVLTGAQLDEKATAVVRGMLKTMAGLRQPDCLLGCHDCRTCRHRSCTPLLTEANASTASHVALARHVAAEAAVLLKNEGGLLPIAAGATVAVVGSACDAAHSFGDLNGLWNRGDYYVVGGSGRVISDHAVSVYAGLVARAAAAGITVRASLSDDADAALATIRGATLAIACGGAKGQEDADRSTLALDQHGFLSRLAAEASAPLVAVAFAPGPLAVGGWSTGAAAALAVFLSGQETGHAVAQLLLGEASPSGKLPVTFYADEEQVDPRVRVCTSTSRPCVFSEGVHIGWRALEDVSVAFPFGHGLTYGSFELAFASPPRLVHLDAGRVNVSVAVSVRNVGTRAAAEVVQLYVRSSEPLTTLGAFVKTSVLQPSESATVTLELPPTVFEVYDYGAHELAPLQPLSEYTLLIGTSSRDIKLQHAL